MSTFPSHFSCEDVIKNAQASIASSQEASQWSLPNPDQARARDAFLFLVCRGPATLFEQYKDHSFWANWRSKSSEGQSSIVHFAIRNAKDEGWIEKLFDLFPSSSFDPPALSAIAISRFNSVSVLEFLNSQNMLVVSPSMLLQASKTASWETFEYLWRHPSGQHIKRVEGVEASLVGRRLKKGVFPRQKMLEMVWERWGAPSACVLHEMHKVLLLRPLNLAKAESDEFFTRIHNPSSPSWTDQDYMEFLKRRARYPDFINETLKDPSWHVPQQVWEDFVNPMTGEKRAQFESMAIEHTLKKSPTPFRASPTKKM